MTDMQTYQTPPSAPALPRRTAAPAARAGKRRDAALAATTAASSDFDWLALVGGGIKYGLGGVVTAGATYILAWGLDALFGLEVGKPGRVDQKQQIIEALGDINDELDDINDNLTAIAGEITALNNELDVDFYKEISAMQVQDVKNALAAILSTWQTFQSYVVSITNSSASTPTLPDGTTATFAGQILDPINGIRTQINVITLNLLPAATSPGLLDSWTSTMILEVQQGTDIYQSYLWLERSFLQYVHYLYYGHSLMVAALIRQGWTSTPGDEEANKATAQAIGEQYLSMTAGPNLAKATQMFLQCVHRLILSQYMTVNAQKNGFNPFLSQAVVDSILSRANLAAWLITRTCEAPENPGIVVTSYLRPSQIVNGQAPALSPSSAYQASNGTIFPLEYGYASKWFKVIDTADGTNAMLRDFNDSSIVIVDYVWSDPTPKTGAAVGTSGIFASLVPQSYDTSTLSPATSTDNTVVYGYTTDMSSILGNMIWNSGWAQQGSASYRNSDSTFVYSVGFGNGANPPRTLTASFGVNGSYDGDDGASYESFVICPMTYKGSGSTSLNVFIDAQLSCSAQSELLAPGYAKVPIEVGGWCELPKRVAITAVYSVSESDRGDPANTAGCTMKSIYPITISPDEYVTPTFVVTCNLDKEDWYKVYNDYGTNSSIGSSAWTINNLVLAWPQPSVS